jgi:hypothetical protein
MTDATYVLYSLKAKKGDDDHPTFSPHVWKSILDLTSVFPSPPRPSSETYPY